MNREYIESGILELYIFGLLTEPENSEVQQMADKHDDVKEEILFIEQAVINLSFSVAPHLSAANFEKVRERLLEKHAGVVQLEPKRNNAMQYLGWAAAVIFMVGFGFQYYRYNEVVQEAEAVKTERSKFESLLANVTVKNDQNEKALGILRHKSNTTVKLEGQAVAPEAFAKIYVNNDTKEIYVDVAGLPEPPQGKVYQVWALKLEPLTPTSIGIVETTKGNNGIFKVESNDGAQAFGITLEPAGGSPSPTLDQLYTLGKV